jgi:hypothetical protein
MADRKTPAKGGRPAYKPSQKDVDFVEAMAKVGTPQEEIAKVIGVDPKTLRKYFAVILETAGIKANAMVGQSLYQNAVDGNVAAQIWWSKTRMGWKETSVTEHTGKDGGAIDVRDARESLNSRITGIAARIRTKDDSLEADTETSGSA